MTAVTFNREYRTADKAEWGHGDWQDEPDKAQWIDPATGLDCLLVRNGGGALCGYVGVGPDHPWHGRSYGECGVEGCDGGWDDCYDADPPHGTPERLIRVHGGITFSAGCANTEDESRHICHVPLPGRPHDVWWFGFDCAHAGDYCPAYTKYGNSFADGVYRDVAYVQAECADLARQLAAGSL